jgi:hypothetical protein
MALDFDPTDDLAGVVDGLTSVTLTRPGSSITCEVTHALRGPLGTREAERSEGRYAASDAAWHLPASELSVPPQLGDVIVDADGQRWTVLDVKRTTRGARWRCVSRNLVVAHGLDDYVDVEKATYVKGDGGAEVPTWHTWKTGLRARIQPAEMRVEDEKQRRAGVARFKVFLLEDVALDPTCRIRGPDGTVYRVAGSRKSDRIDALMEIDVVRVG